MIWRRFGQVLGPLLASALIAMNWSNLQLFFAVGFAPALGGLAILALRSPNEIARGHETTAASPSVN